MLVYEHARITKSTTYAPLSTGVTHSPHKEWQRMPVPTGADSWKCQLPLCQATDHSVRLCPRSLVSSCCSPWAQYHPSLPSLSQAPLFSLSRVLSPGSNVDVIGLSKASSNNRPLLIAWRCSFQDSGGLALHVAQQYFLVRLQSHFSSSLLPEVFLGYKDLFALACSLVGTPSSSMLPGRSSASIH